MSLYDIINMMGISNWGIVVGGFFVFTTLIQVSPIKINPWSWFGNKIKNFFIGELKEEMKSVKEEVKTVNDKLDAHIKENQEETARKWRHDILDFSNQELNGRKHTKEQWDDVLPSCVEYERFCEKNNISNEKAKKAIKDLNRRYELHMANADFLKEDEV